jgi:hypothetical protein
MQELLVYSDKNSTRLRYILKTLFQSKGISVSVTDNEAFFRSSSLPKLNYSAKSFDHILQIIPHGILFEYGIKDYFIEVHQHPVYNKLFFKTSKNLIPFDLLGASFWLISRYEEYLPFKANKHNVFDYRSSIAWQNDFLFLPLINIWLQQLLQQLKATYPHLVIKDTASSFKITVDIDSAYKFLHKGFVRSIAGLAKDILNGRNGEWKKRIQTLIGKRPDDYDCYDFLIQTNRGISRKIIYFFLLGDYGVNDKNHSANNLRFRELIKHLADYSNTGIHPSFASNTSEQQLKVEISRLSHIVHREVSDSRQHFGMLIFPNTYQSLIASGIKHDYSLGYTQVNGFRASYNQPFCWYDLRNEEETSLVLHPYCLSDVALEREYVKQQKSPIEKFSEFQHLFRSHGGELIIIFHNDMLGNTEKGKRWQQYYSEIVKSLSCSNY